MDELVQRKRLLDAELRILRKLLGRSTSISDRMLASLEVERREQEKIRVAIQQVRNQVLETQSMIEALVPQPNYETAQIIDTSGVGSGEVMGVIGG